MKQRFIFFTLLIAAMGISGFEAIGQDSEKPLVFKKKIDIQITNALSSARIGEPVTIPLADIMGVAPDFTPDCFRVKRPTDDFEPLDIPSQIMNIQGTLVIRRDLVFIADLGPRETKTVELWYKPERTESIMYPAKTQSFAQWYHLGTNIAWENEIIAYRSYNGYVDFFAKSHPHLRLHNLPPDSYHHEHFWGLDPYMIGSKPGLCGIKLKTDGSIVSCFGVTDSTGLTYVHKAVDGGPVAAGAIVQVFQGKELLVEQVYLLFDGRRENRVIAAVSPQSAAAKTVVMPGMQRFETPPVTAQNYIAYQGRPVEEYGTISTALIWNPTGATGALLNVDNGDFIPLKPDKNGMVTYLSMAAWNRASADQPSSNKPFILYIEKLAAEFASPVKVTLATARK